eukprot:1735706-Pyramimonas_sp.AAC.1
MTAGAWSGARLALVDGGRDDRPDLRRESAYLLNGSEEPINNFLLDVLQEAGEPKVGTATGPSCGAAENAACKSKLVWRSIGEDFTSQFGLQKVGLNRPCMPRLA